MKNKKYTKKVFIFLKLLAAREPHVYQQIFRITAVGDDRITATGDVRITANSDY